jgi:hypothetical protein
VPGNGWDTDLEFMTQIRFDVFVQREFAVLGSDVLPEMS